MGPERADRRELRPDRSETGIAGRLCHRRGRGAVGQHSVELAARRDVELREDLAQVVGDRVRADVQARADLWVREAVAREPCDLNLLSGAVFPGLDAAPAGALAGRRQLALGAPGERLGAHAREHLERGAQLPAGVEAAALTSQPFPVEEVSPGELEPDTGTGEMRDRLAIQTVGELALAEQRTHARLDSERPLGA